MSWQLKPCFNILSWTACCLLLLACSGPTKESPLQSATPRVVWPDPPQQARIEFIRGISKPEDLGITPSFWNRIVSVFVGKQEIQLLRPTSAVMTANEVLFVADPGVKAVHRFDIRSKRYDLLQRKDDAVFNSPVSLAVDADNRVYVSDSALNQIFLLEEDAAHALPFKTSVALSQPTGLAFDSVRNRLYVVNTRQHEVLAFDPQGKLQLRFGRRGAGASEFNYPTQVWSDPSSGDLWVTDSLNFRVQHFTQNGQFIATLARVGDATGNLPRPKGVATDSHGHVYIMDGLLNTMQIFNQQGDLLLYLGEQGRGVGQFWLPVGIFIDRSNRIFVADSFNNRVQVFRLLESKG
jgi:DNA-binding beta-propeller fold protein YncE